MSSKGLSESQRASIADAIGFGAAETAAAGATAAQGAAAAGATGTTAGLSTALSGAAAAAKSFLVALVTNPITWAVAGFAALAAVAYRQSTAFDRSKDAATEAMSAYQETESNIESLNTQLSTNKSRLEELQALRNAGQATLTDEAEIASLQRENAEIERQIALLEQKSSVEKSKAATEARNALSAQTLTSHETTMLPDEYDVNGYSKSYISGDIITTTQQDLQTLKKLQKEYDKTYQDFQNAPVDSAERNQFASMLEEQQAEIDKFKGYVSENLTEINSLSEGLDPIQDAGLIDSINDLNTAFASLDLSPVEQAKAALDSFFNGSTKGSLISDAILDMVKHGDDATEAIQKLGLSLDDLGLDSAMENATGWNKRDKIEVPVAYRIADNALDQLQEQLDSATSQERRVEIQMRMGNLLELQQLSDAFISAHA